MTESEKYRTRIRNALSFLTSLKSRTIVGVSIVLVLTCLLYVLPAIWAFILNVMSKAELTRWAVVTRDVVNCITQFSHYSPNWLLVRRFISAKSSNEQTKLLWSYVAVMWFRRFGFVVCNWDWFAELARIVWSEALVDNGSLISQRSESHDIWQLQVPKALCDNSVKLALALVLGLESCVP